MSVTTAMPLFAAVTRLGTPVSRQVPVEPRRPIVTRAETAECTCPEACERDHERD